MTLWNPHQTNRLNVWQSHCTGSEAWCPKVAQRQLTGSVAPDHAKWWRSNNEALRTNMLNLCGLDDRSRRLSQSTFGHLRVKQYCYTQAVCRAATLCRPLTFSECSEPTVRERERWLSQRRWRNWKSINLRSVNRWEAIRIISTDRACVPKLCMEAKFAIDLQRLFDDVNKMRVGPRACYSNSTTCTKGTMLSILLRVCPCNYPAASLASQICLS